MECWFRSYNCLFKGKYVWNSDQRLENDVNKLPGWPSAKISSPYFPLDPFGPAKPCMPKQNKWPNYCPNTVGKSQIRYVKASVQNISNYKYIPIMPSGPKYTIVIHSFQFQLGVKPGSPRFPLNIQINSRNKS